MKIVLILFVFLFSFFMHSSTHIFKHSVYAQEIALSISPPLLEVMIKPGKSITQVYKIANSGETATVVPRLIELTEYGPKEDVNFQNDPWINFLNNPSLPADRQVAFGKPFLLPKGEERQFVLRINPPLGTVEKDYYRVIFFTSQPNSVFEISESSIRSNIGSILLLHVTSTGLTPLAAQISKFEAPKILDSFGPLNLTVKVKNTGKTYFRPLGNFTLSGPLGKANFPISPNVILVGQTKMLASDLTSDPNYSLSLPGIFLGKYQIGVGFSLGEGNIKVDQYITLYAIPWKIGASAIIVIGLIILFTLLRQKARRKRRDARPPQ